MTRPRGGYSFWERPLPRLGSQSQHESAKRSTDLSARADWVCIATLRKGSHLSRSPPPVGCGRLSPGPEKYCKELAAKVDSRVSRSLMLTPEAVPPGNNGFLRHQLNDWKTPTEHACRSRILEFGAFMGADIRDISVIRTLGLHRRNPCHP